MQNKSHVPVMLNEVITHLDPKEGEVYVDCTFGAGGYTEAILNKANCTVYAIDQDPNVIPTANALKHIYNNRFHFIHGNFADMHSLLASQGITKVDGIVMDIGVSSMQLDQAERGFSFMQNGPLDMRMNSRNGMSAADFINTASESEIADVIYKFGDERKSRAIARKIIEQRKLSAISTTLELANIVRSVVRKSPKDKIDPATRTFQAIRIYINDELNSLAKALNTAYSLLVNYGRLVVVSFHSLEDKIVKSFITQHIATNKGLNRHIPALNQAESVLATLHQLTRGAIAPSDDEVRANPRARSAKLRAVRRIYV
jgi:16S rRNA (cytosine1402-N4)-methyltransferase